MGWVEPVMKECGLYAVMDTISRAEPRCVFRIYADKAEALAFEKKARLLSKPYAAAE